MSLSHDRTLIRDGSIVNHTLHGLVTIRLINAPDAARNELEFLLGPSEGQPTNEPDITVSFADNLGPRDGLRYIGLEDAGYDASSFYLISRGRRAEFDLARLGEPCSFVCERGASIFPYLLPVISLRLLRKGYVMLHGASFVYDGKGILVTGWQKGGKTETLLAFMAAGAHYLADEWTIVSPIEGRMWGIPGTLQIWDWHLRCLPEYWRRLRARDRHRLRLLRLYQHAYRLLPMSYRGHGPAGHWLQQLSRDGGIARFGQARCAPKRLFAKQQWHGPSPIDLVLLAGIGTEVGVSPIEPAEIARRMVGSLTYERHSLLERYAQFRYAFPDRSNELLESAARREEEGLIQAFLGRPAFQILHPYPVPLHDLYRACLPIVRQASSAAPIREVDEAGEA